MNRLPSRCRPQRLARERRSGIDGMSWQMSGGIIVNIEGILRRDVGSFLAHSLPTNLIPSRLLSIGSQSRQTLKPQRLLFAAIDARDRCRVVHARPERRKMAVSKTVARTQLAPDYALGS